MQTVETSHIAVGRERIQGRAGQIEMHTVESARSQCPRIRLEVIDTDPSLLPVIDGQESPIDPRSPALARRLPQMYGDGESSLHEYRPCRFAEARGHRDPRDRHLRSRPRSQEQRRSLAQSEAPRKVLADIQDSVGPLE